MKLTINLNKYDYSPAKYLRISTYIFLLGLLSSCNVYKHLEPEHKLINQHKIIFVDDTDDVDDFNNLKYNLKNIARPRANRKSFGLFRNRLSAYYRTEEDREYGWYKKWLKKNIAEPPALYDTLDVVESVKRMTNYLHDLGYWNCEVSSEVKTKKHTVNVEYLISLRKPIRINNTKIFSKDPAIDSLLQATEREKILVNKTLLSNENYQKEVDRISNLLRNNGYAAFLSTIYIDKLRTDTLGNARMEIFLVEDSIQHQQYTIGNINVYLDEPNREDIYPYRDTLNDIIYHYNKTKPFIKPKLIDKKIEIRPNSLYKKKNIDNTRILLGEVAIFNRAPINQQVRDSTQIIDYTIRLQRRLKYAWNTDLTSGYTIISDQNRLGFSGSLGFLNRNTFRSGELFTTQVRGGFEFDLFRQGNNGVISTDFQFNNSLQIPAFKDIYGSYGFLRKIGFINPKFYDQIRKKGKTNISANVQLLSFIQSYSYQNHELELSHSVQYKNIKYSISQTGFNYWKPKLTDQFRADNEDNPNLIESFKPRILIGLIFRRFDMNYLSKPNRRGSRINILGSIDASGHEVFLANAIYRLATNSEAVFSAGSIDGIKLNFAQFFKFELDGRYTKQVDYSSTITTRAQFGLAIPYGFTRGTNVVPYVAQFSVGGPFSLRGWEARELGPGSLLAETTSVDPISYAQKGDLKIEFNIEYRTRLFWYLHGALFIDAGNVWSLKKEGTVRDEEFRSNFYKQIAVAAGYGFRFDYDDLFVIRLDLGYKLRQANNDPIQGNWIVDNLKLANTNFNFAVGYPF